jgi:hypothetical protein
MRGTDTFTTPLLVPHVILVPFTTRPAQLAAHPGHMKALLTRASCFMRKRMHAKAIEDYSVVRVRQGLF